MSKKKTGLPKRIAGVKVPKRVRKGPMAEFLGSKIGKTLLAEALVAAGGGLAVVGAKGAQDAPRRLKRTGRNLAELGHDAGDRASQASANLAYAFREASRTFVEALNRGAPTEPKSWETAEDLDLDTAEPSKPDAPERSKKASRSFEPGTKAAH